jgi:hypothetical protein
MPISFVMELHYSGIGCLGFVTRNTTRERGCRRDVLGRKRTLQVLMVGYKSVLYMSLETEAVRLSGGCDG